MPTAPQLSETVSAAIVVKAEATPLPRESDPSRGKHVFAYNIAITNESGSAAQLLSRHWVVIDSEGRRQDIRGDGVVGKTPRIEHGETFSYRSICPLPTPWGTMEGSYQFRRDDGTLFDVPVARFFLVSEKK